MRLPLKYQVALAPATIVVLLLALIVFTQMQLSAIRQQNEAVREWTRVVQHVSAAIQGTVMLDQIAGHLETTDDPKLIGELHFRYLDQVRQVNEDLGYPELLDRLSPESRAFIAAREHEIRFQEPLDTDGARIALAELIPRLEAVHGSFFAKKRYAFTEYYRNVKDITTRLGTVALAVLGLCITVGIVISVWTMRSTRKRLRALASQAGVMCREVQPKARDELDQLASCMNSMTRKLIDVVATEKLLEGAEDERRRIAMDMHDQTLADITGLGRELSALRGMGPLSEQAEQRLHVLEKGLDELAGGIRRVIDDLHPQTLEMLGLEAALRSYLQKRLGGPARAEFYLHVGAGVEARLGGFERLNLYRIVVEAAHNIVRHAHAARYEIDIRLNGEELVLTVEDNGTGMDREALPEARGRGVNNIEQRAAAMGAELRWGRSRFSSGTRLELRLKTKPTVDASPSPAKESVHA